jgi:hypothetical protein
VAQRDDCLDHSGEVGHGPWLTAEVWQQQLDGPMAARGRMVGLVDGAQGTERQPRLDAILPERRAWPEPRGSAQARRRAIQARPSAACRTDQSSPRARQAQAILGLASAYGPPERRPQVALLPREPFRPRAARAGGLFPRPLFGQSELDMPGASPPQLPSRQRPSSQTLEALVW